MSRSEESWKPGASDRERSHSEHGVWHVRPHGLRARETRGRDRRDWQRDAPESLDRAIKIMQSSGP